MSSDLVKISHTTRIVAKDSMPKLGSWHWLTCEDGEQQLACVTHIGSNYAEFKKSTPGGGSCIWDLKFTEVMAETRPEPDWRPILQQQIDQAQNDLRAAVRQLASSAEESGLRTKESTPTLLPSVVRVDPKATAKTLTTLRDTTIPEYKKTVEAITQRIVALQKDLLLPLRAESERLLANVAGVDQALSALEIYAGIEEKVVQLREGSPASIETPVTVRQMLRYMDEECLVNWDAGGMDYRDIKDFDTWVSKTENFSRLCPEPRCVVALQVRRHAKNYKCSDLADFFRAVEYNERNQYTYLLCRNGDRLYRIFTQIDFRPRLLPSRTEFSEAFTTTTYDWEQHKNVETPVGVDDLKYDECVAERRVQMFQYNRALFLLQGLLDRSSVFEPHPPINLSNTEHVAAYFSAVYDEDGLPDPNPPDWEAYVKRLNSSIKIGSHVFTHLTSEREEPKRPKPGARMPRIVKVTRIKKDRSQVRVSWPYGTRWGYEKYDRFLGYHGKLGDWPVNRNLHCWFDLSDVLHAEAYTPGDYKPFLCDAALKGEYLTWAAPLLSLERWHAQQRKANATRP